MISYDERSIAEQTKDVEGEMKFGGDKLEKKGDLPGGNKWFQGSHQDYARIISLIKGSGSLVLALFYVQTEKRPSEGRNRRVQVDRLAAGVSVRRRTLAQSGTATPKNSA